MVKAKSLKPGRTLSDQDAATPSRSACCPSGVFLEASEDVLPTTMAMRQHKKCPPFFALAKLQFTANSNTSWKVSLFILAHGNDVNCILKINNKSKVKNKTKYLLDKHEGQCLNL